MATNNRLIAINKGDELVDWYVITKDFRGNALGRHGVNNIYISAKLNQNSILNFYVSCDNGDWVLYGTIKNNGFKIHRVPLVFRATDTYKIKIEGQGQAIIEALERKAYIGGKNENTN